MTYWPLLFRAHTSSLDARQAVAQSRSTRGFFDILFRRSKDKFYSLRAPLPCLAIHHTSTYLSHIPLQVARFAKAPSKGPGDQIYSHGIVQGATGLPKEE